MDSSRMKPQLSENALRVLEKRYLRKDVGRKRDGNGGGAVPAGREQRILGGAALRQGGDGAGSGKRSITA